MQGMLADILKLKLLLLDFQPRFDFSGNLLPFVNEDISIRSGLHHHGEEPNRPGYSLDELMTLCRR